jgi:hemolysin-activating ACP:hemolysin acyltransferase
MAFWPKKSDESAVATPNGASNGAASATSPPPAPTSLPHNVSFPADPTATGAAPQAAAPALTPEQLKDAAMASKLMMAGFGEIVSVLIRSQEHRNKPLAALEELVIPAVLTGQYTVAQAQSAANGLTTAIGVVMWARVSQAVDQHIAASIAEPVKLQLAEWRSGPILWIVDAAGEGKVIEAMLARLIDGEWKGQEVRMRARTKDGTFKVGTLARPQQQTSV